MVSEKTKFQRYLRDLNYTCSPCYCSTGLVPHYYIDDKGNHLLISGIACSMFEGIDSKPGDLGCVTFYYNANVRRKYHRTAYQQEVLKEVKVRETAKETIEAFEQWQKTAHQTITSWDCKL